MITDEIVYTETRACKLDLTETRVWKLDHAGCGVGPKETARWAKAIGWGHLCTLDFFFFFFFQKNRL